MPNLGAIGSNVIFCEGAYRIDPQALISATPEDNEYSLVKRCTGIAEVNGSNPKQA